jgi:hypothetical protein
VTLAGRRRRRRKSRIWILTTRPAAELGAFALSIWRAPFVPCMIRDTVIAASTPEVWR